MGTLKNLKSGYLTTMADETKAKYTLGYEFEIPYLEMGGPSAETKKALAEAGYPAGHHDSGGWEVGSPVHGRLDVARSYAKRLMAAIEGDANLEPDNVQLGNCGIHVHTMVNDPKFKYQPKEFETYSKVERLLNRGVPYNSAYRMVRSDNWKRTEELHYILQATFNRAEATDFIKGSSHRFLDPSSSTYKTNATPNKWDTRVDSEMTSLLQQDMANRSMIRTNTPKVVTDNTIEFRIWKGVQNRLIPAIEFGHAAIRWGHKVYKEMPDADKRRLAEMYLLPDMTVSAREKAHRDANDIAPRLRDFFDWVGGQKGYSNLKGEIECHA